MSNRTKHVTVPSEMIQHLQATLKERGEEILDLKQELEAVNQRYDIVCAHAVKIDKDYERCRDACRDLVKALNDAESELTRLRRLIKKDSEGA